MYCTIRVIDDIQKALFSSRRCISKLNFCWKQIYRTCTDRVQNNSMENRSWDESLKMNISSVWKILLFIFQRYFKANCKYSPPLHDSSIYLINFYMTVDLWAMRRWTKFTCYWSVDPFWSLLKAQFSIFHKAGYSTTLCDSIVALLKKNKII